MKIVRISALWCSGCLVMKKIWKDIEKKYNDIEYIDYDYDYDYEEIEKYNIGKIVPVNIFFKDGKEITRLIGEKSISEVEEVIKEVYYEN